MMRWNELSKQLSDATKSVVGSAQSKFQSSLAGNVVGEVAFSSPKEEEIILDEPLEEITLDPTTASSTTDSQFDIISGTLETVPRAQLEIAVLKSLQNIKVLKKKIKQEEIKATAAIENSHQSSKRLVQMQDELDRKEMTLIRTVASLRDELSSRDTEVENLKSQLKLSDSKTQDIAVLTSNMETTSRSYTDLIEKYNSLESKYHALMNTQSIVEGNPVDDLSVLQNNELIELKKMYHESESHFNSEINKYKFEISRLTADAGGSKLAPCLSKVESPRISFIEDNDSRGVAPPPPPPPPPSELTSEYFSILCEILGLIRHRVYEAQSNSDSNLFDFTYAFEALKSRVLLPTQYHTMLVELLSSLIEDIANTLKRLHSCEEELKRVTKEKTTLNDTVRTAISREAKLKGLLAAANDSLLSTQSQLDGYSETKSNVETQLIELENRYKILSEKYYKETTPPINANVILKVAVDDVIWVCTKNDKTSWWPEKSLDANTSSIPTLQQSLCNEQMALQENFRIATLNVKRLELQNSRLKESEESLQNKVQSLYVSSSRPRTAPAPTSSCSSCATASQEKLETENRYERMLQDAKQAFDNIQTTLSDVILEKDKQMDYLNSSLLESSSLVDLLKSRNADLEVELRKLSLNVQQQQQQQQLIRNKTIKLIRCDLPAIDSRRFNSDEDSEAPSAAASSSEDALFHKRSSSSSSSVVVEEKGFLSRHVKDLQGELKLEQEKRIVLEELSGFLKMELLKLEKLLAIKWDSTGSMTGGTPIEFVRNTIIKLMETDTTKTDEHESLFFVLADIFKFDENERRRLLIKNNNNNRGSRWF